MAGQPALALPFAPLNLRRNPFGELPDAERAALAVVDLAPLAALLRKPRSAVQLMGESGRGKTTRLLALRRLFPEAPYLHLREDEPLPEAPDAPLVLLDEAQRLPRRARRRLFASRGALAIATHDDLGAELARAGRECMTVAVGGLTPETLVSIARRRIEWARRGPGRLPRLSLETARTLLARYGDDVRSIAHHLYDLFCELEELPDGEL